MLGGISERRVAVVVAPAGSGKTTLLAQFAAASPFPVAWYRAEPDDATAEAMVHGLATALAAVFGITAEPRSIDDLVAVVDRWSGDRAVLMMDDLHHVAGTKGEAVLQRMLEHAPPTLRIVLASRHSPGFNLSRLRVSGDLIEVGPDDLRFRSWEVERLFHDFYGERLPPDDLAELTWRTEGWAAGLQLFHLATRGKPLPERRRILTELSSRSGMVPEYLAQNVLDALPDELRRFLLGTCVLGRLSGPLCDELLDTTGSEELLQWLASRQIFTVRIEGGAAFRYHEVLRSHLSGILVTEVGESEAKQRHRQAGELLQRSGAVSEALWAFCRAGDWHAAAHILGRNGGPVGTTPGRWIDALPPGLLEQDPWLLLAKARRYLEIGSWPAALGAYGSAERGFPAGPGQEACGRERRNLSLWLEPSPSPRTDWIGLLRTATQGQPLEAAARAQRLPDATGRLAEGIALLLAGRMADGRRLLERVVGMPDLGPFAGTLARLLAGAAAFASAEGPDEDWDSAVEDLEAAGLSWIAMLVRTTINLIRGTESSAGRSIITACEAQGDEWGAALLLLAAGFVRLERGDPASPQLLEAAARFRGLDAATLEQWAAAGGALALAREGDARAPAASAQASARSHGVPGARLLTYLALARLDQGQHDHYAGLARAVAEECAMRWPVGPTTGHSPAVGGPEPPPGIGGARPVATAELRCFGGFHYGYDGLALDMTAVKPRVKAALHLLAVHVGRPIHRERLVDAFWPDVEARAGIRNLQVVVSTLRRLLELGPSLGGAVQIVREGDSYRLILPSEATADVALFDAAVLSTRVARKEGDDDGLIAAAERALGLYLGDLLPEAGPAEWIVSDRERYRREAADVSQHLAELRFDRTEYEPAVEACERGLALDRYRDALWRTLAGAYDSLGDTASAARARRSYGDVLDELGLS
jgi:DNA-binding SARP family transcriptional activator